MLKVHESKGGSLVAIDETQAGFKIRRVFSVKSFESSLQRGKHAHRACYQYMISVGSGAITIECSDSQNKEIFYLEPFKHGLLIPPGIWAKQIYENNQSILNVYCSGLYDESDYINNEIEFKEFKEL